ncbi:MAG: hypothetical protein IPK19_39140 [Chloroflexi bacterium]|nr:hypothetical protein [Chloroflexota bacterium]
MQAPSDLIWINGENFFPPAAGGPALWPVAQTLPTAHWSTGTTRLSTSTLVVRSTTARAPGPARNSIIYDSARLSEDDLPRSFAELTAWIAANPGRFTYIAPGPGGYMGTRFVKQIFFELSGGHDQWLGDFNPALYDEWAPQVGIC